MALLSIRRGCYGGLRFYAAGILAYGLPVAFLIEAGVPAGLIACGCVGDSRRVFDVVARGS